MRFKQKWQQQEVINKKIWQEKLLHNLYNTCSADISNKINVKKSVMRKQLEEKKW